MREWTDTPESLVNCGTDKPITISQGEFSFCLSLRFSWLILNSHRFVTDIVVLICGEVRLLWWFVPNSKFHSPQKNVKCLSGALTIIYWLRYLSQIQFCDKSGCRYILHNVQAFYMTEYLKGCPKSKSKSKSLLAWNACPDLSTKGTVLGNPFLIQIDTFGKWIRHPTKVCC